MKRAPMAEALDLQPHSEGGWFRETYRSATIVQTDRGPRASATAIYYLLSPGEESRWHVVSSDELWIWNAGGRLELSLGGTHATPHDEPKHVALSIESPQILVPAGVWQAARPIDEAVLVTCVVSPGFDFADFRLLED